MKIIEILHLITCGLALEVITQEALPLKFKCRCSHKKALDALAYFPLEERQRMIIEDNGAEVSCHWCREVWWLKDYQIAIFYVIHDVAHAKTRRQEKTCHEPFYKAQVGIYRGLSELWRQGEA